MHITSMRDVRACIFNSMLLAFGRAVPYCFVYFVLRSTGVKTKYIESRSAMLPQANGYG
jgi:hypothetical protein